MRLPRVQFTLRRMMIVIAIVGTLSWAFARHPEATMIVASVLLGLTLLLLSYGTFLALVWSALRQRSAPGPSAAKAELRSPRGTTGEL